jgi:DMSO/TMAO reductase YedYZ molybdopterin-dependent catalytic subunit/glyoxylase-like metal-dependent hydrolase (beta-lactamase superfamily II)/rhodanese-related sulfurtransferase
VIFTQHYLGCLSHASYVIGDETTGRAVVVDPRRDVDIYLDEAGRAGLTIERIIETHLHADFLSGHLELAERTGADIAYGAGAAVEFPVEHLVDGQRLSLGEVTLEVLATPGHTPESICVVVYEHADDAVPYGVLTGDTLFVGDVGRPDLVALDDADLAASANAMARKLFSSLHDKLLQLPDATRVFPAHGAGSSCGRQLSSETSSTIGQQRRTNYALQVGHVDDFVAAVTEGQPARPRYFEFDARRNRERRALLDDASPPRLDLEEVLRRRDAGAVLLDAREPHDFASAHLRFAINVGLQGRFAEWAADVLSPDGDIVLVGDPALAAEAKVRLARVGYDRVVGQLDDLAGAIVGRPDVTEASSRITVDQLAALVGTTLELQLVDVRGAGETASGVLPRAREIPLAALVEAVPDLDRSRPTVVYCASGYRSQIAASVLRRAGFPDVSDVVGGTTAWQAAGLPITRGLVVHRVEPLNCETSLDALIGGVVMPAARFYVRNHFATPSLDPATWRLEIGGLVEHPMRLGLRDLRSMPSQTLTATLECAGNGRSGFEPAIPGEPWQLGAVSTAEWTGVPLAEVLARAGPTPEAVEVLARGADGGVVEGRDAEIRFERSLSIDAARRPEVLVAYAMNGEPLPREHGQPARLIVPGRYAVASVKWLTELTLIDAAFTGYFQSERYVYEWEREGGVEREPVGRQHVRALITDPRPASEVPRGEVMVRGVAWSGGGPIATVEVSVDDGAWQPARLVGEPRPHCWQWWELLVTLDRIGPASVRARATDVAGATQPERAEWNRLGYGNNSIQTVLIAVT